MIDRTSVPGDSDPDMNEALRRVRADRQRPPASPPADLVAPGWLEDIAHDQLVAATVTRLRSAQTAALSATEATVQLGFVTLARDLMAASGRNGGTA
ncbi:hypothetical protein [Streptomyces chartreusis]|uniref:hypothetical protein n=1 Tax=Streptomyces chartreusis TaxID=1969 RepID=UPI003819EBFD